jgi:hypothetical protein
MIFRDKVAQMILLRAIRTSQTILKFKATNGIFA